MNSLKVALRRLVWGWLGYTNGLPVNNADLTHLFKDYERRVAQMMTDQLTPQFNEIRQLHADPARRRLEVATNIVGHLLGAQDEDGQAVARAVAIADDLIDRASRAAST